MHAKLIAEKAGRNSFCLATSAAASSMSLNRMSITRKAVANDLAQPQSANCLIPISRNSIHVKLHKTWSTLFAPLPRVQFCLVGGAPLPGLGIQSCLDICFEDFEQDPN